MKSFPLTQMALLIALATVVAALEGLIQLPVPYFRIGLAHVITLLVIRRFGMRYGLVLILFRTVLAHLILGKLFQPQFLMSFFGGVTATLVMGIAWRYFRSGFSLIGISILGAFTHNIVQVLIASAFIVKHCLLLQLWPLLAVMSILAGILIGGLVIAMNGWIEKHSLLIKEGST